MVLKDFPNAAVLSRPQMKQLSGGYDPPFPGKICYLYCGGGRPVEPAWIGEGHCPSNEAVARACGGVIPPGTSCNCV